MRTSAYCILDRVELFEGSLNDINNLGFYLAVNVPLFAEWRLRHVATWPEEMRSLHHFERLSL